MAEEDFDIDFYGDDGDDGNEAPQPQQQHQDDHQDEHRDEQDDYRDDSQDNGGDDRMDERHHDRNSHDAHDEADESPSRQGTKRKSEEDDRPVDPNATAAIMISELNWWTTDDDIRGWLRAAECEGEVKELTFSEHKVNGKSKG